MAQALLFVLSEPGTVSESDFHDWYDDEHAPARVAFEGVENAVRWRATDAQRPGWLATYDVDPAVLERPDYRALREHRSAREQRVIAGLETFERRTYELVSETPAPTGSGPSAWRERPPGAMIVAVSLDVPLEAEDELAAWYSEEHVPLLLGVEGWSRTRRYRLVQGEAPRWLALHDVAGPEVFEAPGYLQATSTPRRAALMAQVTRRERRVFAVHRRLG